MFILAHICIIHSETVIREALGQSLDSPLVGTVSLAAFLLSVPALTQDLSRWKARLPHSDSPKTKDKMKALKEDSPTSRPTWQLPLEFPFIFSACCSEYLLRVS